MDLLWELRDFNHHTKTAYAEQVLGVHFKTFPEYDQYYSLNNVRDMMRPLSSKY